MAKRASHARRYLRDVKVKRYKILGEKIDGCFFMELYALLKISPKEILVNEADSGNKSTVYVPRALEPEGTRGTDLSK